MTFQEKLILASEQAFTETHERSIRALMKNMGLTEEAARRLLEPPEPEAPPKEIEYPETVYKRAYDTAWDRHEENIFARLHVEIHVQGYLDACKSIVNTLTQSVDCTEEQACCVLELFGLGEGLLPERRETAREVLQSFVCHCSNDRKRGNHNEEGKESDGGSAPVD